MSIKKTYSDKTSKCKVTFKVNKEVADSAEKAFVVGEFNNWSAEALAMKKLKDGTFSASLSLEKNKEYQFKYLLDGNNWQNDPEADKYVPNEYMNENSVVVI